MVLLLFLELSTFCHESYSCWSIYYIYILLFLHYYQNVLPLMLLKLLLYIRITISTLPQQMAPLL